MKVYHKESYDMGYEQRQREGDRVMLVYIGIIVLAWIAFWLLGCQSHTQPEEAPELSCTERWTDVQAQSHCGHRVQFLHRIVSDTTAAARVVGRRYYCYDDSAQFVLPTVPIEVAK